MGPPRFFAISNGKKHTPPPLSGRLGLVVGGGGWVGWVGWVAGWVGWLAGWLVWV